MTTKTKRSYGLTERPVDAKWTGDTNPPKVGDRVFVRMNSIGVGTVLGFFVEEGFLGVYVLPDKIPAYWAGNLDNEYGRKMLADAKAIGGNHAKWFEGSAMVFGMEVGGLSRMSDDELARETAEFERRYRDGILREEREVR